MPLHIDHRPKTLSEVEGNRATIDALSSVLRREKDLPHTFLFTGNSGCGKTTLGRIVANELGCNPADLREVDSADFRGIDSIREIRQQSRLKPMAGPVKVWLLDECHKMTNDAQNALLKILEDTPPHIFFILCTTDPEKLLKTIKSRCMQFSVGPLSEKQMTRLLKKVIELEGIDDFPDAGYSLIHQNSQGHVRAGLVILDKVMNLGAKKLLASIEQAATEEAQTSDLCKLLLNRASWSKVRTVVKVVMETQEAESVRYAVLGWMNAVLLREDNKQAYQVMDIFKEPFYNTGKPGLTLACYEAVTL